MNEPLIIGICILAGLIAGVIVGDRTIGRRDR